MLNVSGIDTQQSGNAYATQAGFGGGANVGGTYDYDDDILMDTSGSTMNDFIGDKRVLEQFPTGDGATMQFTPSTGIDGYAMVDEADPDDDTTYIEDATVGHVARFTFPALPVSTAEVLCADVLWFGKKTDAGTRTVKGSVKSVASTASGADFAMATSYGYGRPTLPPLVHGRQPASTLRRMVSRWWPDGRSHQPGRPAEHYRPNPGGAGHAGHTAGDFRPASARVAESGRSAGHRE